MVNNPLTLEQCKEIKIGFNLNSTAGITLNGPVVVIDPGYIFPTEAWDEFCDEFHAHDYKRKFGMVALLPDGREFYVTSTAHGDGGFPILDKNDNELGVAGVDSGILAVIPLELAKELDDIDGAGDIKLGVLLPTSGVVKPRKCRGDFDIGDNRCLTDGGEQDVDYDELDAVRELESCSRALELTKNLIRGVQLVSITIRKGVYGLSVRIKDNKLDEETIKHYSRMIGVPIHQVTEV